MSGNRGGVRRRRFLRAGALAGVAGVAGCLDGASADVAWRYETDGVIRFAFAASDGRTYVGTTAERLHALESVTGVAEWVHDAGQRVYFRPALLADGLVLGGQNYADTAEAVVSRVSRSGTRQWRVAVGHDVTGSPVAADGTVYVGGDGGELFAIDASDGSVRWRSGIEQTVWGRPTVVPDGADTLLVATVADDDAESGGVAAYDAATGERRWRTATGDVYGDPVVADDVVYAGSTDGRLYALSTSDGSVRWRFEADDGIQTVPAVTEDTVYVGSLDYNLYAIDRASGTERWRFGTGNAVVSSPTVTDGTVYVGSNSGSVFAVDAADGSRRWSYLTDSGIWTAPVVAEGRVFVGTLGGRAYEGLGDWGGRVYALAPP